MLRLVLGCRVRPIFYRVYEHVHSSFIEKRYCVMGSTVKTANGTYLSQYILVFVVTCGSDPVYHISVFFIVEFSFVSGTTEFSMSRQHCYVGIASWIFQIIPFDFNLDTPLFLSLSGLYHPSIDNALIYLIVFTYLFSVTSRVLICNGLLTSLYTFRLICLL